MRGVHVPDALYWPAVQSRRRRLPEQVTSVVRVAAVTIVLPSAVQLVTGLHDVLCVRSWNVTLSVQLMHGVAEVGSLLYLPGEQ